MVSEDGSATESASPGFNSNCGEVAEHPCVYLITTFLPSLDKGESRADLTVFPAVKDLQEAEVVVHLASKTDLAESVRSPHITYYTNILSTLNLLEMARQKEFGSLSSSAHICMVILSIFLSMRIIPLVLILHIIKASFWPNKYVKSTHQTMEYMSQFFDLFIYMVLIRDHHLSFTLPFQELYWTSQSC